MARYAPDIFDGVSIEDLVDEAFVEFFCDKDQLGWNPNLGNLETFLWTVTKRIAIDHFRRGRRERSLQDDSVRIAAEQRGKLTTDPRPALESLDRVEHLKRFVSGNPELEQLFSAAQAVEGPNINQQIAARLLKTPQQVVNLKKRLQRLVKAVRHGVGTDGKD